MDTFETYHRAGAAVDAVTSPRSGHGVDPTVAAARPHGVDPTIAVAHAKYGVDAVESSGVDPGPARPIQMPRRRAWSSS
jgi:hypothetical protein